MKNSYLKTRGSKKHQKGAALAVSLILLVIITLVAIAGMKSALFDEKLAAGAYDRSLSFQTAETALKLVESSVEQNTPVRAAGDACSLGICPAPSSPGDMDRWLDPGFMGWESLNAISNGPIEFTPEFLVEYLGDTFSCDDGGYLDPMSCKRYRITVKTAAGDNRSSVMLQTIYATQ